MKGVYLLHFTSPYRNAQHYIGYSDSIYERYVKHIMGTGNPLVAAAIDSGITVIIARVWPDRDRNFERSLKNRKNARKLCPICKPAANEKERKRMAKHRAKFSV